MSLGKVSRGYNHVCGGGGGLGPRTILNICGIILFPLDTERSIDKKNTYLFANITYT